MHSWIHGVARVIYGGQHHVEHDSPLQQGHPATSNWSTILLREYQLVLKVPIGTAPSKIHLINAIFILVIQVYLTSPLGATIQKYHGAIFGECTFGGRPHAPRSLAIDRTVCIHFVSIFMSGLKILAKPRS
jgi:hypothetical protein